MLRIHITYFRIMNEDDYFQVTFVVILKGSENLIKSIKAGFDNI
jgi:hypothetical protein